ncbi:putative ABC transporter F family member 3 [Blattamonas nauphoetae]|uniref:ABC transporter F family member 3 n=1 Tax=Blattamonas nauphoetae TaxID=2049346 RepID=A0ABQ9XBW2_9EUKA|nr:putative ABC transporter F family member 3 [Blattamonas nauphoetae]
MIADPELLRKEVDDFLEGYMGTETFGDLSDLATNFIYQFVESGLCTDDEAAYEQLGRILPSWGICAESESRFVCSRIGDIASKHNIHQEMREKSDAMLRAQREKLGGIKSLLSQKSGESYLRSVTTNKQHGPRQLKAKGIGKGTTGPDPDEEKFQDPNQVHRLTYLPDLHEVTITKPQHADRSTKDEIRMSDFSMAFAGKPLLDNANLHLIRGHRYGLVGRNGVGKSTLLRHIARGSFELANNPDILFIEQEVPGNDASPLEWVLAADVRRAEMLREEERLLSLIESTPIAAEGDATDAQALQRIKDEAIPEDDKDANLAQQAAASKRFPGKVKQSTTLAAAISSAAAQTKSADRDKDYQLELQDLYEQMSVMQFDSFESRAKLILHGLGFSDTDMNLSSKLFSGGWRMRISLARALFREPMFLFLDEPTNHLDLPGALFLEQYLKNYQHGLIIVSHDRYFLNRVCTDIVFFNNLKLTQFRGDYDTFETTRNEQYRNQLRAWEKQQAEIAQIQRFIDFNIAKNEKHANAAQSRQKLLDKIERVEKPAENSYNVTFRFPELGSNIKSPFMTLDKVYFAYVPGKTILANVSMTIGLNSRIALIGQNGAGKSTLLKLMDKSLGPGDGDVWVRPSLTLVRFSQHAVDEMPGNYDPLTLLTNSVAMLKEFQPPKGQEKIRAHLGSFGITGPMATQLIGKMSGGERMRVALAHMTLNRRPHLLLLDEPTNHLDLEAREALAKALSSFQGAVVMVTHDQNLITQACNEIWVVEEQKAIRYMGSFDQYKKQLMKKLGL